MSSRSQGTKSRPQSASHRRTDSSQDEKQQPGSALLEDSECYAELKEGILAMLERQPQDPLLFLAGFFSDKVCSNLSAVSKAYCCIRKEWFSHVQFMDNVADAFNALQQAEEGNSERGVRRQNFDLLLEKLIGANFPQTVAHMQQLTKHMGRRADVVSFSDFSFSIQMCVLIQQLQSRGATASREAFYQDGADSLQLPRHVLLDVVKQFKFGLDRRKDSQASSSRVLQASEKIPVSNADQLDGFICHILSIVASPFPDVVAASSRDGG